jgi:microsomal dipeptidase-like Zn-dependent dipeptidase
VDRRRCGAGEQILQSGVGVKLQPPVGSSASPGIFLGPNTSTLEAMTRHLEYAIELVGVDHVGISRDLSFD